MKKFKFLPSVLMLVACIAVLCVGVLSIKPIENTIGGTITISAGKANLNVSVFVNDEEIIADKPTVSGVICDLSDSLHFNATGINTPEALSQKLIRIDIDNLSDTEYGAFFYTGEGLSGGYATYSSILHEDKVKKDGTEIEIASVVLSSYTYLPANGSISMYILIDITRLDVEVINGAFNYDLRLEEYRANATSETYSGTDDLVKFSAKVGGANRTTVAISNNSTAKEIVLPNTITTLNSGAFSNLSALEHLIVPTSVTSIENRIFNLCPVLTSLSMPIWSGSIYEADGEPVLMDSYYGIWGADYFDNSIKYSATAQTEHNMYIPKTLTTFFVSGNCYAELFGNIQNLIICKGVTTLYITNSLNLNGLYVPDGVGVSAIDEMGNNLPLNFQVTLHSLSINFGAKYITFCKKGNLVLGESWIPNSWQTVVFEKGVVGSFIVDLYTDADNWYLNGSSEPLEVKESGASFGEYYVTLSSDGTQDFIYVNK